MPLRAEHQPIADRHRAGGDRAGHDEPDPGQGEGPVDRHPEQTRCGRRRAAARGDPGALLQMLGKSGDPLAGPARHREDRALGKARRGEQRADLRGHRRGPAALDPVDLGDDPGDLGDPDQLQDVEMLEGLRARPVIGGDDQQHPVDRQHAGQHVGQKALMPGHIDKAELGAVGQCRIGEAEIDRQPAPLLLGQAVGIDPGQRADQRGLAVIDMAGRRQDHGWPTGPIGLHRHSRESGNQGSGSFAALDPASRGRRN